MLSSDQTTAMTLFAEGKNIFLTGPGGTGKSFLIHRMIAQSHGKSCQVCALTGCAALLLECHAKTIHSWSGIYLMNNTDEEIIKRISRKPSLVEDWNTDILIVDEVSMMSRRMFELLNRIGQTIRGSSKPFGGIQVVFVGDFFQLPPIEKDGFCFESEEWFTVFPKSHHVELTTCFRQSDSTYIDLLMKVRKGVLDPESIALLENYVARKMDQPVTKVVPLRKQADGINQAMFDQLQEPAHRFPVVLCAKMTMGPDGKPINARVQRRCDALSEQEKVREFEALMKHHQVGTCLVLKKGAQVMCTRNIDSQICNGSQGVVEDMVNGRPMVLFTNGRRMTMEKIWMQSEQYPTLAVGQYPLALAWAVTIHKIQGCTLSQAQLDIGGGIFEYGQTYVALSRVKSLDGLYLINFNHMRIKAHPKVLAFYESL